MKILFIYPNAGSQVGFNYGIAHLSAVLKQAGHDVALWQLCDDIEPLPSEEQFADRLSQETADIIGFSVVTNQWPYAKKLASWAREVTDAPLVCGGIHTMAAAEEILQSGVFDYILRGEAEEAFAEFVEKLSKSQDLSEVKNLGFMRNKDMRLNPLRPLPDLKKLPLKDYEIFDFQNIIDAKNGWVVGTQGAVLRSQDGGISWQPQSIPGKADLNRIRWSPGGRGWIVGEDSNLLVSSDGGENWRRFPKATQAALKDVLPLSAGPETDHEGLLLVGANGLIMELRW